MTDLELEPYLVEAIARTGVERYRHLCLEYHDLVVREQYRGLVVKIARGEDTGQRFEPGAPAQPCCDGFTGYVDPQ